MRISGSLPEHGALHGGALVGQRERRAALPAGARRRQVAEEEVRHALRQLRLLRMRRSILPLSPLPHKSLLRFELHGRP